MIEVASFRPDDRLELVDAALACRVCLSGDVRWTVDLETHDASVVCRCATCGDRRRLFLNEGQALRLALASSGG